MALELRRDQRFIAEDDEVDARFLTVIAGDAGNHGRRAAVVLALGAAALQAHATQTVNIGVQPATQPIYIAKAAGLLAPLEAKYDVRFQLRSFSYGAPENQAMAAGELDLASAGMGPAVVAAARLPVKLLGITILEQTALFVAADSPVRHITDLATAQGMSVIVDFHHYEELFRDPLGHAPRFAGLWRQIALAFKDAGPHVYFELINEPHDKMDAGNLWAVQGPALAAVRESNPTRPVVINGPSWSSLDGMIATQFPDDPYIVPTFHWYDPANFGFEKAPWMTPPVRGTFSVPVMVGRHSSRAVGETTAWLTR